MANEHKPKKVAAKKTIVRKTASPTPAMSSINVEDYIDEVRARAMEIFHERAGGPGDELSDWLQAEREIKKKYKLK